MLKMSPTLDFRLWLDGSLTDIRDETSYLLPMYSRWRLSCCLYATQVEARKASTPRTETRSVEAELSSSVGVAVVVVAAASQHSITMQAAASPHFGIGSFKVPPPAEQTSEAQ